ncbi:MAG: YfhO family protein [Chloroflexota bacterium]
MGFDAPRGQLVIETTTSHPGVLVMSEAYYVERHAWLDGREVPLLKANIAFSAVALPAGHHIVELRYVPTAFYIGLAITSVTLIIVFGILSYSAAKKRQTFASRLLANE